MQLPGPVRAAIGLAANVADETRRLPDRAIELPMLAVSTVLQASLRAQQRYAALTARGDEVLSGRPTDAPPPWAVFDETPPEFAGALLDEVFGAEEPASVTPLESKRVSKPRARRASKFDDAGD